MRTSAGRIAKKLYFWSTGYSYTHLGRLFLRLFVGIMLMQFGIRQIACFDELSTTFPTALGMDSPTTLVVMIIIEIVCSAFIMVGFMTRMMIAPPFVAMTIAEFHLLHDAVTTLPYLLDWQQLGYLPIMFLGIYFFLLLVGPGKISVDYFLSLHIIHSDNQSESQLEEV